MASSHPSFVIVPGAWHQPEMYEKLVTSLKGAGCSAVVCSLPSCDAQDPQKVTCSTDAEAVRKQIVHAIEAEGKDVVVVCHSYGGVPGGGGAFGLSKLARSREGQKGGVAGLIYVAGFLVPGKISLLNIMGGKHAPYVNTEQPSQGQCTISSPRDYLFHDLDKSEADRLTDLLRPTSMLALDSPAPPAAWAEPEFAGKLVFIRCMQDQALPPFLQDMFVEKSGVEWKVKDMDTSHSPFASKPEELVKILVDVAEQFNK